MITLVENQNHKNVMFNDLSTGSMVQCNQHVIVNNGEGMILDPGGHKVYNQLFPQIASLIPMDGLKHVFFSHQDPDIIAAANGWLMVTDATAWLSKLWMRFIPHFGVDKLVIERISPIEDEGATIDLGGSFLKIIPAHFLHSAGNFQVYDPVGKILYTGDLGASLGCDYETVEDFDHHIPFMEGFHKRYIPSGKALRLWANMAKTIDIEIIAPQHGAILQGREVVNRFIEWAETLECGIDLMGDTYRVPN